MIADRIKYLREMQEITQIELAHRLGITRASVSAWEQGFSVPSTQKIVELARLFKVSTDYLLEVSHLAAADMEDLTEEDIRIVQSLIAHLRDKNRKN